MKIQDKAFVAIDYTLTLDSGEEVDRSEPGNPMGFIYNSGQMIPGLEKKLLGKEVGWSNQFIVEADEGYGQPKEELFHQLPRKKFPADLKLEPGMAFETDGPDGAVPFIIKSVTKDLITIDLNHPLCGERLHFTVTVKEVRDATESELAELEDEDNCQCKDKPIIIP